MSLSSRVFRSRLGDESYAVRGMLGLSRIPTSARFAEACGQADGPWGKNASLPLFC